jgi:hypothetical protein
VKSELFERRVKLEDPVTCAGLRLRVDSQPQEHDAPALAVHRVLGAPGTSRHVPAVAAPTLSMLRIGFRPVG